MNLCTFDCSYIFIYIYTFIYIYIYIYVSIKNPCSYSSKPIYIYKYIYIYTYMLCITNQLQTQYFHEQNIYLLIYPARLNTINPWDLSMYSGEHCSIQPLQITVPTNPPILVTVTTIHPKFGMAQNTRSPHLCFMIFIIMIITMQNCKRVAKTLYLHVHQSIHTHIFIL